MIVNLLQFLFRAEFHKARVLIDPNRMPSRLIKEFACPRNLLLAIGVADVDRPFENVTPVWAVALVVG